MLVEKHQQLYYIFLKPYIYQDNTLAEKNLGKHLESYIDQEQNQIQKDKYQRLHHTFLQSYIFQERVLLQQDNY